MHDNQHLDKLHSRLVTMGNTQQPAMGSKASTEIVDDLCSGLQQKLCVTTDFELDSDALRKGMESLPQEICNLIYDEVFTAPRGVRKVFGTLEITPKILLHGATIHTHVKEHLHLLHVSRASRELFAKTFYDARFIVHHIIESPRPQNLAPFISWLKVLPAAHRDLIREIISYETARTPRVSPTKYNARIKRMYFMHNGIECGKVISTQVGKNVTAKVFFWGPEPSTNLYQLWPAMPMHRVYRTREELRMPPLSQELISLIENVHDTIIYRCPGCAYCADSSRKIDSPAI